MYRRCCRPVTCHQPAASSVLYTTNCKYSLVFLSMGETIARNILSWLKLLKNYHCCIYLVVCIIVSTKHGHTKTKFKVFSFCLCSCPCIMARWWPESRVETGCHVIKLFSNCVLVVTKNIDRYYSKNCFLSVQTVNCSTTFCRLPTNAYIKFRGFRLYLASTTEALLFFTTGAKDCTVCVTSSTYLKATKPPID